ARQGSDDYNIGNISARVYRLTNESLTKVPVADLAEKYWDKRSVVRVRRNGEVLASNPNIRLQLDDEILILGTAEYFTEILADVGQEITPEKNTDALIDTAQIVVINPAITGKKLSDIKLPQQYGVLLKKLTRTRVEIPCDPDIELKKGDILTVTGLGEYIDLLGKDLGHVERAMMETDMVTFSFGIAIGVLIGLFAVNIGNLSIGLGSAGGLLASGLAIGYLRSVKPTFGRMPDAARWFLMEFGLLLFMAGVGLRAGADIIETLAAAGPTLILAGIVVTTVPIAAGYSFGRLVLKIHPVYLLGGITGSMTSGASLSVVTKAANSSLPSLGYTGAYAFANVLLTVAGSIILYF
ncbi:TrkA C-terminal domain-containing protein, partial [Oleiphilus sp. HI0067]